MTVSTSRTQVTSNRRNIYKCRPWNLAKTLALLTVSKSQLTLGFVPPPAISSAALLRTAARPVQLSTQSAVTTITKFHRNTRRITRWSAHGSSQDLESTTNHDVFDDLLERGELRKAISYLQQQPQNNDNNKDQEPIPMDKARWARIFDAIELRTTEAEENNHNLRQMPQEQYPLLSPARQDMTDMYQALQDQGYLTLYGAVQPKTMPALGSKTVAPVLLEQITDLSMKALTPQPTSGLLVAGGIAALLEALASVYFGIDFNLLVFATLLVAFVDRLFLNGAVVETLIRIVSPGISERIAYHEAGHFLLAYLLGCPVEGYVLSAWAALQDKRFDKRQVSAGTSFFDAKLSKEFSVQRQVSRSSLDRYSIIVMAGIAAEALHFGRADGGAGDEMALIYFLSQLNSDKRKEWNDLTIRNQARWGALQAVLTLKHYKPCYDALVDALQRGGSLGDCIYAIEKAARDHKLQPLQQPLGYILDEGPTGTWTMEPPQQLELTDGSSSSSMGEPNGATATVSAATRTTGTTSKEPMDEEASLQQLKEYRLEMEEKLRDIDEQLKRL